jgi:hypothetical protein
MGGQEEEGRTAVPGVIIVPPTRKHILQTESWFRMREREREGNTLHTDTLFHF